MPTQTTFIVIILYYFCKYDVIEAFFLIVVVLVLNARSRAIAECLHYEHDDVRL